MPYTHDSLVAFRAYKSPHYRAMRCLCTSQETILSRAKEEMWRERGKGGILPLVLASYSRHITVSPVSIESFQPEPNKTRKQSD